MRSFWVADLTASGDLRATERYEYALVERLPAAAEFLGELAGRLYRSPQGFEVELGPATDPVRFRWLACSPTCGMASFRLAGTADNPAGTLALFCVLLSGLNPGDDETVCRAVQSHLSQELRDTGIEPGFDLIGLRDRPLLASFDCAVPASPARRALLAVVDRYFAAAYFRRLALA